MCSAVSRINQAVDREDAPSMLEAMQNPGSNLHSIIPDCGDTYMEKLQQAKLKKSDTTGESFVETCYIEMKKHFETCSCY